MSKAIPGPGSVLVSPLSQTGSERVEQVKESATSEELAGLLGNRTLQIHVQHPSQLDCI